VPASDTLAQKPTPPQASRVEVAVVVIFLIVAAVLLVLFLPAFFGAR
jgi:hypothetical protein